MITDAFERARPGTFNPDQIPEWCEIIVFQDGREALVSSVRSTHDSGPYLRRHPEVAVCMFIERLETLQKLRNSSDQEFAEAVIPSVLEELDMLYVAGRDRAPLAWLGRQCGLTLEDGHFRFHS